MRGVTIGALIAVVACGKSYGTTAPEVADAAVAQTLDGGTLADADASPDASPACTATFCDGFERSAVNAKGTWSELSLNSGSAENIATIDQAHVHHGTSAFHVELAASTSAANGPELLLDVPSTGTTHVSYAFWIFAPSATRHVNIAEIDLMSDAQASVPNQTLVILSFENGTLSAGTQRRDPVMQPYQALAGVEAPVLPGAWNDVRLDIDLSMSVPLVTVQVNGTELPSAKLESVKPTTTVGIGCGPSFGDSGEAIDVWYDDVTVNVE